MAGKVGGVALTRIVQGKLLSGRHYDSFMMKGDLSKYCISM